MDDGYWYPARSCAHSAHRCYRRYLLLDFLGFTFGSHLANRNKKIKEHNKQVAEYRASAEFSEGEQDAGSKQANSKRQVVSPTAQQPTNLEGTQASQTGSSWRPRR